MTMRGKTNLLAISLLMIGLSVMLNVRGNPYYKGPPSDHYDGGRFSSVEPVTKKNWLAVIKWRLTGDRKQWPEWVDVYPSVPPVHVKGNRLQATFINHSTVLLQTQGLNILTDPIWSERCSPFSFLGPRRVHVPGVSWDNLPKIDLVLISHSHYDHLDLLTIKRLAETDHPLFIVPLGVDAIIHKAVPTAQVRALDWHEGYQFNDAVRVNAEPAQHWSARTPFDDNRALWASFVLQTPGGNIFFTGDTGYGSGRVFRDIGKKYGSFRFAMLAIGAYEPRWFMQPSHMNPEEAVRIFKDVHATYAMPIHFGTFQLTDEGRDEPVADLEAAIETAKVDALRFHPLAPGETWNVPLK